MSITRPKMGIVKNLQLGAKPKLFLKPKRTSFHANRLADICQLIQGLGWQGILSIGPLYGYGSVAIYWTEKVIATPSIVNLFVSSSGKLGARKNKPNIHLFQNTE